MPKLLRALLFAAALGGTVLPFPPVGPVMGQDFGPPITESPPTQEGWSAGGKSGTTHEPPAAERPAPEPPTEPLVIPPGMHGPKMRVESLQFDWGTVLQGTRIEHAFEVHNDGDMPLMILNVKPGCGCTTNRHDREIPVGGVGRIELTMDTKNLRNVVEKSTTVTCNDPGTSTFQLKMKGTVQTLLEVTPQSPKVTGLASESKSATFEVRSGSALDVVIHEIHAQRGLLQVTHETLEEGKRYRLSVTAGAAARPGMERDILVVKVNTSDGQQRETELPVLIDHQDRILITPRPNLFFRRDQCDALRKGDKSEISQTLLVTGARPEIAFQVTGVEVVDAPPGVFVATHAPVRVGHEYRVTVTLQKVLDDPPHLRAKLLVHTDDPERPTREAVLTAQFADTRPPTPGATSPGAPPGRPMPPPTLTPRTVTPPAVAPQAVTPQAVTPQAVTPQIVTPQVVTPQAQGPGR